MDFSKIGQKVASFVNRMVDAKKDQIKGGVQVAESIFTGVKNTLKDDVKNIADGDLKGFINDKIENVKNTAKGVAKGAKKVADNSVFGIAAGRDKDN